MEHKWQGITTGIWWCDGCGALKNTAGRQTAYCPVAGNWSYTEPACRQEAPAQQEPAPKMRLTENAEQAEMQIKAWTM